jgi:LCP family protein required for cell wall assembly
VPINGVCCQKINAAFSEGGPNLTVKTVKGLTGVSPNYLVTVDFGGFIQLVNEIGGVYVMVDQHYYHVNTPGTEQYSQIDIPPGYQLLSGVNALAFSRYRHTDSDFYRNARQQVFLRSFEQAASHKFHGLGLDQLTALRDVVETITSNVQITGHSGVPSVQTLIRYLALAYRIKGHLVTVKLDATTAGDATNSYVTATPEAVRTAIYQWEHPQELWHPDAIPGTGGKKTPAPWTPAVTPSTVQVTVLNGNGRTGSAGQAASDLQVWGYQASPSTTPAPTFGYKQTWVYYRPGAKAAAADLAHIFGDTAQSAPIPATSPFTSMTTPIVVVVGAPFQGKLALAAPPPPPSTGPPSTITPDPTAYQADFAQAQRTVGFPVLYPTVSQANSSFDPYQYDMPVRTYAIEAVGKHPNSMYAYWAMPNLAGAYWGIEETRFTSAPILANPDAVRTVGGRKLQFYLDGSQIHLIAYVHHGVAYWVTNTLRDDLTNPEMIAIAKSLRPVS